MLNPATISFSEQHQLSYGAMKTILLVSLQIYLLALDCLFQCNDWLQNRNVSKINVTDNYTLITSSEIRHFLLV